MLRLRSELLHCLLFTAITFSAALLLLTGPAVGQANPGTPSFSAYDRGQYDTVNLQNLNVSLNIPVYNKSGAFPFNASLVGGDSYFFLRGTSIQPGLLATPLAPSVNGLLSPFAPAVVLPSVITSVTCPSGDGTGTADKLSGWYLQMPDGTVHNLPASDVVYGGASCSSTLTDTVIDGTGWTVTINGETFYNSGQAGVSIVSSGGMVESTASLYPYIEDAQSTPNKITYEPPYQEFFDTLGVETMTVNANAAGQLGWFDVNEGNPTESQTLTSATLKTSFGCSGKADYPATAYAPGLTTAIAFPDGTSLGLAWEPNEVTSTDYTGRLAQITLRNGSSTVKFNYNPSNAGAPYNLNCTYLVPNKMTRTTSDGTVSYTWASANSGSGNTTTKVDIGGNKTVYTFTGLTPTGGNAPAPAIQALTEIQYYVNTGTVSNPVYSSTPTRQDVYCYGTVLSGQPGNCPTAVVDGPVMEQNVYTTLGNMATSSRMQTNFDKYGNITYSAQYDYTGSNPVRATTTTYGSWNGSACVAVSSTVNNKPCQIVTTQNGYNIAYSRFTYSSSGNLLKTYVSPNGGSSFLSNTTSNVYNSNGTPSSTYDLANNLTSYAYTSSSYTCAPFVCNNYPFPTSISKGGLTSYSTWNGIGGVKVTDTDSNGATMTYGYEENCSSTADPWWRVGSITDALSNKVCKNYTPTSLSSSFSFGSSAINTTITLDGYGRVINTQTQQGPSNSNWDTVSTTYGFSGIQPTVFKSLPCSKPLGTSCGGSEGVTTAYDMLGREVSSTDSGGGTQTITYLQNDALSARGPAPSGENPKQTQNQYDGLGRLQYSCAIGSVSGSAVCNQNTGSSSGVTTSYIYPENNVGQTGVYLTRGGQTRSTTYDSLNRVVSDSSPEGGNINYVYDSYSGSICGFTGTYSNPGHLLLKTFANGNNECYIYDGVGRLTDVGGAYSSVGTATTLCKRYRYDNSQGVTGSLPTGISPQNPYGRIVEAETDNCQLPFGGANMITDEWFSYDKDGNMTDMWELTPHSGIYYHSHATFAGNGVPLAVQLASPSLYTETYGLDGEGRLNTLMSGSIPIVSGTTYNPASQPTYIDLGTGTDQSDYVYDPNTGRMTNWTFQVGSTESETGALTWNPNGTLKSLVIADGFNAGGSQTCYYNSSLAAGTGYDDLGRLVGVSCGSIWAQTFSYDEYDNITKSGSITWNPGYNPANNQYSSGASYDSSGNLTYDTIHTYAWDEYNKLSSIDTSACATNGDCITYDAFGRMVESSYKGTYTEIWYTQVGKTAYMLNGSSIYYAYWPTPGGGTVEVNGNNVTAYYMHKDWLGSSRISSVIVNPAVVSDQAYAPYSEVYNKQATGASVPAQMFTGDTQDVVSGIFDTSNRELNSSQGRWLSPDPVRAGWNQYAYVADIPLNHIDPSGLFCIPGKCGYGDDDDDDDGPGDPCPGKICDPGPPPGGPPGGPGGGGGAGHPGSPGQNKNTCAGPNPPVPCVNAGNNGAPCASNQTYTVPQQWQNAVLSNYGWTITGFTLSANGDITGLQVANLRPLNLQGLQLPGDSRMTIQTAPGGFTLDVSGSPGYLSLPTGSWYSAGVNYLQFSNGQFTNVNGQAAGIPGSSLLGSLFNINSGIQSTLNGNPDAISGANAISGALANCTF